MKEEFLSPKREILCLCPVVFYQSRSVDECHFASTANNVMCAQCTCFNYHAQPLCVR